MKNKKRILVIIIVLVMCVSFFLIFKYNTRKNMEKMPKNITKTTMSKIIDKFSNKDTFAVYFGFPDCPNCQADSPYIYQAAKNLNKEVFYVQTRASKKEDFKLLYTEKEKKELQKYMTEYMMQNKKGELHLYVPCVVSVINGVVVDGHIGHVENKNTIKTQEEAKEALKIYNRIFSHIK